jgi:hypothetical protein
MNKYNKDRTIPDTYDTLVGRNPNYILQILIIERRMNIIGHIEEAYSHPTYRTHPTVINNIKKDLLALYTSIRSMLVRDKKKELIEQLDQISNTHNINFLMLRTAFYNIDEYLDKKNLLKIDTKDNYDITDWEISNSRLDI